jgi:hypothetical protein
MRRAAAAALPKAGLQFALRRERRIARSPLPIARTPLSLARGSKNDRKKV